jgi:hypothetical protein
MAVTQAKVKDVKDSNVSDSAEKPEKPEVVEEDNGEAQFYVWLSDGSVKRCNESDLPQGGYNHLGHWRAGNKVYQVVGVYPVEDVVGKDSK